MPTISQTLLALDQGEISSVELTQSYLDKIESSRLNAFISFQSEQALRQAAAADEKRKAGEKSTLLGIPIAHKDIFCIEDTPTTCGSRMLENFVAPYTATVIDRLMHEGCVNLGKTNMDEFAMGSSNENSYFGAVTNPWSKDKALVPGGSSGGSAAAVSADLCIAATGTDTGGSIRQPAAFCNLTGIKPSYGRCSRHGMIAFASSLDQAGVLCQTAEDAAIMLNAMCGFDPMDSTSIDTPAEDLSATLTKSLQGKTIGVVKEFFGDGLDNEIANLVDDARAEFARLGVNFIDVSLPNVRLAVPSYYVIAPAEASSNLSRYDGVRYGFRAEGVEDLEQLYTKTRSQGFGAEVKRRIMIGTYALSAGYYDAYYAKAQKIRRLIAGDFKQAFTQCDALIGPTTPSTAFELGKMQNDPVAMYLNDIYTIPVNLAGLPAMSLPCGLNSDGLPVGLQLIAPYMQEARLLNLAHQYQQSTDWHQLQYNTEKESKRS